MNRLVLYLFRWQLSTPVLWVVIYALGPGVGQTIVANLIGGLFFYKLDRHIFRKR